MFELRHRENRAVSAGAMEPKRRCRADTQVADAQIHGAGRITKLAAQFDPAAVCIDRCDFNSARADQATPIIFDDFHSDALAGRHGTPNADRDEAANLLKARPPQQATPRET